MGIKDWITIGSVLIASLSLIATVYFGNKMMSIAEKSADAASKSAGAATERVDVMRQQLQLEESKHLDEKHYRYMKRD